MSRRKVRRRRKVGRRVYYKVRSQPGGVQNVLTKRDMYRELVGTQRYYTDESIEARLKAEERRGETALAVFGLQRNKDTAARQEVLAKLATKIKLDDMDRHTIVFTSVMKVIVLFNDREQKQYWFIERDKVSGTLRKSITYGSWSQAYRMFEVDAITFIL